MTPIETLLFIAIAALALGALTFWIWMLIDCLRHERSDPQDRLLWVLVIVLTKLLGAAIYFFVRHRPRSSGSGRLA